MFYRWPIKPFNQTKPRLGTLGEFRGLAANDITRLHSGTDIAIAGGLVEVYAPDTGLVRRYTPAANGNPSGGGGPIRVGHFAFNHIMSIFARPGTTQYGVDLPQALPIYVEEIGFTYYVPKAGIAAPKKDGQFTQKTLTNRPVVAYRKNGANDYANVSIWPKERPIGQGVQPTDLHCFYYETPDGPVDDGGSIRNALEVFENYKNNVVPVADELWMYSQAGNVALVDMDKQGAGVIHTAAMGGVKFKLWANSPFNSKCGVYQVEYEILNHLGTTTGRLNMWKFHQLPPDAKSFDLVDSQLSRFNTPFNKFTVYILTNSRNADINTDYHWEVEDSAKWPDGCYAIKVWIKNIKQSQGVGVDPLPNEVLYGAEWKVDTLGPGRRKIAVTKRFIKRAPTWQPAFAECPKPEKPKRPKKPRG